MAMMASSGDLISLYIGVELHSLALYVLAAFHRALHRVYDTREGRPFLWFRTIVFGETVLITAVVQRMARYAGSDAVASMMSTKLAELLSVSQMRSQKMDANRKRAAYGGYRRVIRRGGW
jgi:hypothetical protein